MTTSETPEISLVIPCYNEEGSLRELIKAIREAVEPRNGFCKRPGQILPGKPKAARNRMNAELQTSSPTTCLN